MFPEKLMLSPMPCLVSRTRPRTRGLLGSIATRPFVTGIPTLVNSAGAFTAASLAPTRAMYSQWATQIHDFAVIYSPEKLWFPSSIPLLCTFIAHLVRNGSSPASLTSRMSAISSVTAHRQPLLLHVCRPSPQ